jgi:transposase
VPGAEPQAHIAADAEFVICNCTIERTFGWWNHFRRLSKDYEIQPFHRENWILLAMISVMLNRLAPPGQKPRKKPS